MKICKIAECTGCEACVSICPVQCISMQVNTDGFYYPFIDELKCIKCKRCVNTCPNNSELKRGNAEFFMGWHKSREVLLSSSSGGAFTGIAEVVLANNGVVFGAFFDEDKRLVEHIAVEDKYELYKLKLSKYFQSRINDSYINAEKYLKEGRQVLFSGTGCQIAGLYKYLNKQYDNLITVDVLCHGITSKKVVDSYIKSKENKYKKEIKSFRFRIKPNDGDWMKGGGQR